MDSLTQPVTSADLLNLINELTPFIDGLLISVGFSAYVLGFLSGFYLRVRYLNYLELKNERS